MAIDTRQKRFSMLNFGDGSHIYATCEADGTVDLDDRQHLLDCYSGIGFAGAVVAEEPTVTSGGVDLDLLRRLEREKEQERQKEYNRKAREQQARERELAKPKPKKAKRKKLEEVAREEIGPIIFEPVMEAEVLRPPLIDMLRDSGEVSDFLLNAIKDRISRKIHDDEEAMEILLLSI